MRFEAHRAAAALVGIAIASSGCSDTTTPLATGPTRDSAPAGHAALDATSWLLRPRTYDEELAGVAHDVPGFGGVYYDRDGTPVVFLTDMSRAAAARGAVSAFLRNRPMVPGRIAPPARVVRGQYDFRDLKQWRDRLNPVVLAIPGVVLTDIDEGRNRIRIGVSSDAARPSVTQALASLAVPTEAALIEDEDAAELILPYSEAPGTLASTIRPVPGGVQIELQGHGACTLSFNAYRSSTYAGIYSGEHHFVTNAHCTEIMGQFDGANFHQPYFPSGGSMINWIGTEFREPRWDPSLYTNCPTGMRCSLADVALGKYAAGVDWEFGKIARPDGQNTGSMTIDPVHPRFRIRDSTESSPALFTVAHKVGVGSGWTSAGVTGTCQDFRLVLNGSTTDFALICQYTFGASGIGGDSGAPVFYYSGIGDDVTLAGIAWGGGSGRTRFSIYAYLKWEVTDVDRSFACPVFPCWTGLTVSTSY